MSLVSFAIRICAERAILGDTYAEDRVYDSQIVPVDQTTPPKSEAVIILSTDDDKIDVGQWDLLCGRRELEVVFETVLATFVQAHGKDGAQEIEVKIPHTDAGMEAALGFMQRQILRALMDPQDPWAELFKEFTGQVIRMLGRRGASAENGVRFAAKQLVLVCDPIPEPDFGEIIPDDSPWGRLIALMEQEEDLSDLAMVLRAEIENGNDMPSWRRFQACRGWTDAAVRTYGEAPVDPTETGEPNELAEAIVGEIYPDGSDGLALTVADGVSTTYEVPEE